MAAIGLGAQIQSGAGSGPEVFTAFAEVTSITPPEVTVDDIETTHLLSPNGWREYQPGLKEPGEASFEFNYTPGGTAELLARGDIAAKVIRNWRIVYPTGEYLQFYGYMRAFTGGDVTVDGKLSGSCTIKLSGSTLGLVDPA